MINDKNISTVNTRRGPAIHCTTEEAYYQAIDSAKGKLVVVDCFAEWCPPCKHIAPVVDALAREHPEIVFVKVDVDEVPAIKTILGVWVLPSFFFLREGNKVGSFTGANEGLLRKGIANDGYVGGVCSSCVIQ
mmetsp:Transcript_13534/g.28568  ORF Transcript_13534/g.28568 Transcript_13534/m.28568 type:complete len:133 (-) Transcript_13534:1943-2341(-)